MTNALKMFLEAAATGKINPVGDYFNYKNMFDQAAHRKQLLGIRQGELGVKQQLAPAELQKASTGATNAVTRQGELALGNKTQAFNEQKHADAPGRLEAKQALIRKGDTFRQLDPAAQAEWEAAGFDPTMLANLQRQATQRAAGKAGGIAEAQGATGEKFHMRKMGFDAAFRAQDPTNPQNRIGQRVGDARSAGLAAQRDAVTKDIEKMKAQGNKYSPDAIRRRMESFNKQVDYISQQQGFDGTPLKFTPADWQAYVTTPAKAAPQATEVDEYLKNLK